MASLVPTERDPGNQTYAHRILSPTQSPPAPDGEPATDGVAPLTELPVELSGYALTGWLDVEGAGEIDRVARVTRGLLGKPRVVKFYRPGLGPAPGVHEAWKPIDHPGVARLYEWTTAAGRVCEVMQDVGAAGPKRPMTLRDLVAENPDGLPPDDVVDIVGQLGRALAAVGEAGLVHLDLRPDNVLVRPRDGAPGWVATLVDFGSAVPLDTPTVFGVARSLTAYSAPELLSNTVSAATDWWALGVVVAELAVGSHPLLGLRDKVIARQLSMDISLPERLSDRVRLLYEGLTARNDDRWGADQVAEWVDGGTPAPPPRHGPDRTTVFLFGGVEHRHVPGLVAALQARWLDAVAVLFGRAPNRWDEFVSWLVQFDRPGFVASDVVRRIESLGDGPDPWSADARLLALLRHADPNRPAPRYYVEVELDRETVSTIASQALFEPRDRASGDAVVGDARMREVIDDLWRWRLLVELDGMAGGRGLRAVDDLRCGLDQRWSALMDFLRGENHALFRHIEDLSHARVRAHLLLLAADEEQGRVLRRRLADLRVQIHDRLGRSWPEFELFAATVLGPPAAAARGRRRRTGDDAAAPSVPELVGLLALHLLAPAVLIDVEAQRATHDAAVYNRAALAVAWRRRERWRMLDRPVAMGWAAGAMGIMLVAWAALLIVGDALPPTNWLPPATDDAVTRAWAFVLVGLAAETAAELWLAAAIGAPYHRGHSLVTTLLRAGGTAGRRFGRGLGASSIFLTLALVVATGALACLLVAPYAMAVPVAVHVWSARRRHDRWRAEHDRRRREQFVPDPRSEGQMV